MGRKLLFTRRRPIAVALGGLSNFRQQSALVGNLCAQRFASYAEIREPTQKAGFWAAKERGLGDRPLSRSPPWNGFTALSGLSPKTTLRLVVCPLRLPFGGRSQNLLRRSVGSGACATYAGARE